MSKIIAQTLLSLFISLGVVVGVNSDVRGEAGRVWQEAKAVVHQGVDLVSDTAGSLTSQITLNSGAEAKADSEAFVGQTSSEAQSGVGADVHVDISVDAGSKDGFLLNFGSDADTGFEVDLGFWK